MDTRGKVYYDFVSLRPLNLNTCSRNDIREYFENSCTIYEGLFSAITEERFFYKTPERLRLPLIFYLAHSATLYINKMMLAGLIKERVDHGFEALFETGVDEMSWDDTENYRMGGAFEWPSLQSVVNYRAKVKDVVIKVIETAPLTLPIHHKHPWWSLIMAIEHERIHAETSSVLLRQLPTEFLKCPPNWRYAPMTACHPVGRNDLIQVEEGEAVLGKPWDFQTFGWDNEYGRAIIQVPAFEATKFPITNREFCEFVEAGGYGKEEYWSDEGWRWVQFKQARHPTFWVCHRRCKSSCGSNLPGYSHCTLAHTSNQSQCTFKYRAIFDMIEMPWDWPVDVNYHEAKAFCKWKGPQYRLLTEAEHHRISDEDAPSCDLNCDPILRPGKINYNINLAFGSSSPVNYYPPNDLGFFDVYGNVWEWIEDHYNGLPGFETNYLYEDFSTPCFDSRHQMMMGGSWISTGDEASRFFRLYFRRHFFQHLGFRMARSLTKKPTPVRLCQADHVYANRLYTDSPVSIPGADIEQCYIPSSNRQFELDRIRICEAIATKEMGMDAVFGHPLVSYCGEALSQLGINKSRALVLGCGPGYSTFLLTRTFTEVVGVDFGGRLIAMASDFQNEGCINLSTGEVFELPLQDVNTDRATFKQFTWIPNELVGFNFVLFESLERFTEPKGWLLKLHECLLPGGIVILSSRLLSSEKWNSDELKECLSEWFEVADERPISGKQVTTWKLAVKT